MFDLLEPIPAGRIAIVLPEQNIRVTYGALRSQVQAVAGALAAAGVSRNDRVGMALPNGLPTIVAFLAASIAGTAAPLNPGYKEDEFRFYLEDTNARCCCCRPTARTGGPPRGRRSRAGPHGRHGCRRNREPLGVTGSGAVASPAVDDIALILHTSGSTGRPKRVPLTHANLSISARNVARTYALGPDDVSLCVMPLFHVHGLVASTLATLATGGTVVVPGKFSPLSFWRVARDHGVTWYSAVPTLHQLLLARAGRDRESRPAPSACASSGRAARRCRRR